MPKEKDSRKLDQFHPISLFNVEGKIFFGVIVKRMSRFVMSLHQYKRLEFLVYLGCFEHTTILWNQIKMAKNNKSAKFHVIWLYLETYMAQYDTNYLRKQQSSFEFQGTLKTSYQRTLNVPM